MSILQSALVEPLLSRQQAAVIREIARAAQLNEALVVIRKINIATVSETTALSSPQTSTKLLQDYLESEIKKVLMQIKIPAPTVGDPKADTRAPGNARIATPLQ